MLSRVVLVSKCTPGGLSVQRAFASWPTASWWASGTRMPGWRCASTASPLRSDGSETVTQIRSPDMTLDAAHLQPLVSMDALASGASRKKVLVETSESSILASFAKYSFAQLALKTAVLKLCQLKLLVQQVAPMYLHFAAKNPTISAPCNVLVKKTFFRNFCGGENTEEVRQLLVSLNKQGINAVLDPAMEDDLELVYRMSPAELDVHIAQHPSLTEPFSLENAKWRDRMTLVSDSILAMHATKSIAPGAAQLPTFVAIKLTCFFPPALLYIMSAALEDIRLMMDPERTGYVSQESWTAFVESCKDTLPASKLSVLRTRSDALFKSSMVPLSEERSPSILLRPLLFALEPRTLLSHYVKALLPKRAGSDGHLDAAVSSDLLAQLDAVYDASFTQFFKPVCQLSASRGISLMIDAEQSFYQPAIFYLTQQLEHDMASRPEDYPGLSADVPLLYHTYQMYLKEGLAMLRADVLAAEARKRPFGIKLVRGAYMELERGRAAQHQLFDPIQDDLAGTHDNYKVALSWTIPKIVQSRTISLFVASHNQESIEDALSLLSTHRGTSLPDQSAINKERPATLLFGQLFGMSDHLTNWLARHNYPVYKYLPMGPLVEVLPYLLRRAQENSSILGRAATEREQVSLAFRSRLPFLRSSSSVMNNSSGSNSNTTQCSF